MSRNSSAPAPADRLRVLHLHSGNAYGGVETFLVTLARLQSLCPEMEPHFGLCFEGRLSQELAAAGAPVHQLGSVRISRPWTVWQARRRLLELAERERYDAVICHMVWPLAVFGPAAKAAGRKLVLWAHSCHTGASWLEKMARWHRPDFVISNSSFVAASVAGYRPDVPGSILRYPVALVPRPEAERWRIAARREQGVGENTVVILQASRFEAWKGQMLHLRGLANLNTANSWVCWMAGGPQNPVEQRQYDLVRRTCTELGLDDRVRFLGQRSDVPQLLAGADIFCQPNEGPEPFGIVFVEALWAGRPVVSTAMGGALEIVDEMCGILVPPQDAEGLAASLAKLIEDPELRVQLGSAGKARAQGLCDPASQMAALHGLLGIRTGPEEQR